MTTSPFPRTQDTLRAGDLAEGSNQTQGSNQTSRAIKRFAPEPTMAIVPSLSRPVNPRTRVAVDTFHADKGHSNPRAEAEALAEIGNWVRPVSQGDIGACLSDQVAATNIARNRALTLDYKGGNCILREYGKTLHKGDAASVLIFLADSDKCPKRKDSVARLLAMGESDSGSHASVWESMVYGVGGPKASKGQDPQAFEAGEAGDLPSMMDAQTDPVEAEAE